MSSHVLSGASNISAPENLGEHMKVIQKCNAFAITAQCASVLLHFTKCAVESYVNVKTEMQKKKNVMTVLQEATVK